MTQAKKGRILFAFMTGFTGLVGVALPASAADPVADFYKGKQVRFVIGYSAGGGYDVYARAVARYLGKHIPGNPAVVPQNMEGAGSRLASNWLYNVAPKDGTVIGTVGQNAPVDQALKEPGVQFDAAKIVWIGNPIVDNNITTTWAASGLKTIDDVKTKGGMICGGTGANSPAITYPQVLNNLIGLKARIIAGYPGGNDTNLAMERGELNCRGGNSWASTKATLGDQLRDRKLNVIVQWGPEKDPAVSEYMGNDVPMITDFAKTDSDRKAVNLIIAGVGIGRPILGPPGIPAERVAALRKAFDDTMKDPEFLAESAKMKLDIAPMNGEKLHRLAAEVAASPADVVARAQQLVELKDVSDFGKK